ncbi:pyruvate kinase [Candidatus Liberibacter solanacearum]|uniref:Pyruvate kinase n=1 Tax=Candidatus Liberibacter solanacearum TaxID=556287 RepID=A0A094Z4L1_9HYPH|nr:pyruvate kinase [Candidatus Liberibacter solanacearum]KGB27874.1 pyruvate kinase [Candidatus Liberibacter solanacearum]KJZ81050.1 pyruvate kinase [Candidatus Liberibacter solanacearum]KJZ82234.1 Pyruvate kinase [Candidatus Liberibacter solanacearum]KQC49348.1 pyruvate kinase [Candidatus Liberibacter solanacearum]
MQSLRRIKIISTLGPASFSEDLIRRLHEEGTDLFRINMSHTSHEKMRDLIRKIRVVESQSQRPVGILIDLQGPKFRVGKFEGSKIYLKQGQNFTLDNKDSLGNVDRVFLPHAEVFDSVKVGDRLLIDDGKVKLCVKGTGSDFIKCEVVSGSSISDRKGISFPDTLLTTQALTPKDREDLHAALQTSEVDWVALSFIQSTEDLVEIRKIISPQQIGLMSKIEKSQAIDYATEIIKLSDAVMVARGDLGVEMPLESIPGIQKKLIRIARQLGKPIVIATQMLESMISSPVPTRAEVSDVATAVFEEADAIMLSAETASGSYPVDAVKMMALVASSAEKDPSWLDMRSLRKIEPNETGADVISSAARQIAETLRLSAIVCYTASGQTGLRTARERPKLAIVALSPVIRTARRLSLVWGVHCVVTEDASGFDDMVNRACRIVVEQGFGKPGDRIIISAGLPLRTPGSTNMLRIVYIGEDGLSGV